MTRLSPRAATSSSTCRKACARSSASVASSSRAASANASPLRGAFLKNAPLLLLDEATSALDGESEEAIREALGRLMHDRTVIAIAHRLSTVRNFDRVVVLQLGKVVQDGAPDFPGATRRPLPAAGATRDGSADGSLDLYPL